MMSEGFDMQEILELPEKIHSVQKEMMGITDKLNIEKNEMSIRESIISTDVFNEKDDNDKPVFSNKDTRKAAVERLLRSDAKYKEHQAEYNKQSDEMERKKLRLEFLHNRRRAIGQSLNYMSLGFERDDRMKELGNIIDGMQKNVLKKISEMKI